MRTGRSRTIAPVCWSAASAWDASLNSTTAKPLALPVLESLAILTFATSPMWANSAPKFASLASNAKFFTMTEQAALAPSSSFSSVPILPRPFLPLPFVRSMVPPASSASPCTLRGLSSRTISFRYSSPGLPFKAMAFEAPSKLSNRMMAEPAGLPSGRVNKFTSKTCAGLQRSSKKLDTLTSSVRKGRLATYTLHDRGYVSSLCAVAAVSSSVCGTLGRAV
mmetsp:Transcript_6046/g.14454  ORF Transcript_6046/g.14454 Transcript_6046/m.14454 type:complete len:222 (-) Transcript_6046:419-1084(-)